MGGGRRVGVGMDYSPSSNAALKWVVDNLVGVDDQVILIHVQSPSSDPPLKKLFGDSGSPLIPLEEYRQMNVSKQYGVTPNPEVLDILDLVSNTKKESVWDAIVEENNLVKSRLDEVVSFETFYVFLHMDIQHVCSMTKSREFGFRGFADTSKRVRKWVEKLKEMNIIPKQSQQICTRNAEKMPNYTGYFSTPVNCRERPL